MTELTSMPQDPYQLEPTVPLKGYLHGCHSQRFQKVASTQNDVSILLKPSLYDQMSRSVRVVVCTYPMINYAHVVNFKGITLTYNTIQS